MNRVALVTGANRGIGQAIVRALSKKEGWTVLLGSRSGKGNIYEVESEDGKTTSQGGEVQGNPSNVEVIQVDIEDSKSLSTAASHIKSKFGGLDVLVNNAGMAFKGDRFDAEVATQTIATNYYGTKAACNAFLPLIREGGRVVNVSSMSGVSAMKKMSQQLRDEFLRDDLTEQELDALMEKFKSDVAAGNWEKAGWPKSAYGISKAGMSMYTRLLARDNKVKGVLINACCPGYVNTRMSSHKGPLTPDEGAVTPVKLATLPSDGPTGRMWTKEQPIDWA